jgi:hypothetical protein
MSEQRSSNTHRMRGTPRSCANSAISSISVISKPSLAMLSANTALVLSSIALRTSPISPLSTNRVAIPKGASRCVKISLDGSETRDATTMLLPDCAKAVMAVNRAAEPDLHD